MEKTQLQKSHATVPLKEDKYSITAQADGFGRPI